MYRIFKLEEKKDHIIRKMDQLTQKEKEILIKHFEKYPHKEKLIDWNKSRYLTFEDFQDVLDLVSKTQKQKRVKAKGISGLKKGEDYLVFPSDKFIGYIPLTYEASKLIASNKIGQCEGKWCTAYQKSDEYWENYVLRNKIILVYIIYEDTKYAIAVYPNYLTVEIFDAEDNIMGIEELESELDIDFDKDIINKKNIFDKAKKIIFENIDYIEDVLKIKNYKINSDGSYDIFQDVFLDSMNLEEIPIKFNYIEGDFNCSDNNLTSLEGAPKKVGHNYDCSNNNLTSLEGAPQQVRNSFNCRNNNLISLDGAPQKVGNDFNCSQNNLKSLEGAPKEVGTSFYCNDNDLMSLEGAPQKVSNDFNCSQNNLKSLEGAPKEVGNDFDCSQNNLISLDGAPQKVGNDFDCSYNNLNSLDGAPKEVGYNFYCNDNPGNFTKKDVEEVSNVSRRIIV